VSREGQTRVEIRPGAFVWMDDATRKAWESENPGARDTSDKVQPYTPTGIETAAVAPGEKAVQPEAKARKT
jgi:hypothetical protein